MEEEEEEEIRMDEWEMTAIEADRLILSVG